MLPLEMRELEEVTENLTTKEKEPGLSNAIYYLVS